MLEALAEILISLLTLRPILIVIFVEQSIILPWPPEISHPYRMFLLDDFMQVEVKLIWSPYSELGTSIIEKGVS